MLNSYGGKVLVYEQSLEMNSVCEQRVDCTQYFKFTSDFCKIMSDVCLRSWFGIILECKMMQLLAHLLKLVYFDNET